MATNRRGRRGRWAQSAPPSGTTAPAFDLSTEENPDSECWCPKPYTLFQLLFSARLCSALYSNISDCDETFNYWEPTHFLMYGSGFQTWEYSPEFAIRSYAYLFLHTLPGKLQIHFFQANKLLVFYFLRFILAIFCTICEVYFYSGIVRQFGNHRARLAAVFMLFSTGMFISASAFLPSTFAMYMTLLAYGGWFFGNYPVAIFSTAAGALLGWPFSAVLGAPIAWDLVIRQRRLVYFIEWSLISLIVVLGPLVYTDSHYYGKFVITPLNIVVYNVLGKRGPELYGIEPWSFYFMNGVLNFNIVFLMAIFALPIHMCAAFLTRKGTQKKFPSSVLPLWLSLSGMYIWIAVFFTRPHKEERFLFPIYPLLCLCGAVTLTEVQKVYHYLMSRSIKQHYSGSLAWFAVVVAVVFSLLSLSRSTALYFGYHAPLDLYWELSDKVTDLEQGIPQDQDINLCVGREWHRFPSSFFLPSERWRLKFIQSEFKAQLPKPYSETENATRIIPTHMNDLNKEEATRYTPISKCDFLVDLETQKETPNEPNYTKKTDKWKVLSSRPFLDAERSDRIFRAFYVPFLSERHTTYNNYNLLKALYKDKQSRNKEQSRGNKRKTRQTHQ